MYVFKLGNVGHAVAAAGECPEVVATAAGVEAVIAAAAIKDAGDCTYGAKGEDVIAGGCAGGHTTVTAVHCPGSSSGVVTTQGINAIAADDVGDIQSSTVDVERIISSVTVECAGDAGADVKDIIARLAIESAAVVAAEGKGVVTGATVECFYIYKATDVGRCYRC